MTKNEYKKLKRAFKIRWYKDGLSAICWLARYSPRERDAIRSRNILNERYFYINEKYRNYVITKEFKKMALMLQAKINKIQKEA